ncbi:MAG TPA: hypothetical protein VGS58_20425 [Candidatus Sulfopaludibacter sp.]|nr:hypothetical protein [Candidatus Sulfopaludibacter sp.]
MSRSMPSLAALAVVFLATRIPAGAQAAAEAGITAGASSIATAGARSVGDSIGSLLRKLDESLKPAGKATTEDAAPTVNSSSEKPAVHSQPVRKVAVTRKPAPAPVEPLAPGYEEAAGIPKGITYEDLLRRFGPPALAIGSGSNQQTMSYVSKSGVVQVELRSGSVVSVSK